MKVTSQNIKHKEVISPYKPKKIDAYNSVNIKTTNKDGSLKMLEQLKKKKMTNSNQNTLEESKDSKINEMHQERLLSKNIYLYN